MEHSIEGFLSLMLLVGPHRVMASVAVGVAIGVTAVMGGDSSFDAFLPPRPLSLAPLSIAVSWSGKRSEVFEEFSTSRGG